MEFRLGFEIWLFLGGPGRYDIASYSVQFDSIHSTNLV